MDDSIEANMLDYSKAPADLNQFPSRTIRFEADQPVCVG
jgi:hypothetical protein